MESPELKGNKDSRVTDQSDDDEAAEHSDDASDEEQSDQDEESDEGEESEEDQEEEEEETEDEETICDDDVDVEQEESLSPRNLVNDDEESDYDPQETDFEVDDDEEDSAVELEEEFSLQGKKKRGVESRQVRTQDKEPDMKKTVPSTTDFDDGVVMLDEAVALAETEVLDDDDDMDDDVVAEIVDDDEEDEEAEQVSALQDTLGTHGSGESSQALQLSLRESTSSLNTAAAHEDQTEGGSGNANKNFDRLGQSTLTPESSSEEVGTSCKQSQKGNNLPSMTVPKMIVAETCASSSLVIDEEVETTSQLELTQQSVPMDNGQVNTMEAVESKPKRKLRRDGSVKAGKWKLGSKIGSGAFGVVHVGMNTATGTLMAVKSIAMEKAVMVDVRREIQLLRSMNHRNIVRYYGAEMDDTRLHIFQEWVAGGSIASLLAKFGPFSLNVIRVYLRQILEGLDYLHQRKVLHRDIKGSNILISDEGIVKLADFGASRKLAKLQSDMMLSLTMRGSELLLPVDLPLFLGHCIRQLRFRLLSVFSPLSLL